MSALQLVRGGLHTVFPMDDTSRVGEARRFAAEQASAAGLDETATGRLALIVTELGTNLVRHAAEGRLLVASDARGVEVIAIDAGPGIPDIGRAMRDGFSTGSTPGTGLGAIQRLADVFDMHSAPGDGTVAVARVLRADAKTSLGGMHCAGIRTAAPGERVSGDAWAAGLDGTRGALVVADGLGHGPDAAEASEAAVHSFAAEPLASPRTQIERGHAQLRGTRGAAVCFLLADSAAGTIQACGAGNVVARIVSGVSDRTILTQHGTLGLQIRRPEESSTPWPDHALLVVHSDGIETRWSPERILPVLGRDPTLVAAILMRDHCRGRDDACVVVMRRKD